MHLLDDHLGHAASILMILKKMLNFDDFEEFSCKILMILKKMLDFDDFGACCLDFDDFEEDSSF